MKGIPESTRAHVECLARVLALQSLQQSKCYTVQIAIQRVCASVLREFGGYGIPDSDRDSESEIKERDTCMTERVELLIPEKAPSTILYIVQPSSRAPSELEQAAIAEGAVANMVTRAAVGWD